MKRICMILAGLVVSVAAIAADGYGYLTFVMSESDTTSVSVDGLSMTVDGSSLSVVYDGGSTSFSLSKLTKMFFGDSDVTTYLKGDVNEDGEVDINDVVAIINQMAGTASWRYADVNDDEKVDINDVVAVINIMASGESSEGSSGTTTEGEPVLNVRLGNVVYQFPASQCGEMVYSDGTTLTILNKVFTLSDVSSMYVDESTVTDNLVRAVYGAPTMVYVAGNIAQYIGATETDGHVVVAQGTAVGDDTCGEIIYNLSGSSDDGEFYMSGSYKATVELEGVTLTNPSGAALNIQDGKRIDISVKKDTENTLKDGTENAAKGALVVKGHSEFKGKGVLNVYAYGSDAHGIKSGEYMTVKNCTINVLSAKKDGIHVAEYFLMESGEVNVSGVGDDCLQVELDGTASTGATTDHEDEDSGNIYISGGAMTLKPTADAVKGLKAAGDIQMSDGTVTVVQTGSITTTDTDISYPTSMKADGNIAITGGTVDITNTAAGGKGISAEGTLTIDESNAKTKITVKANGSGGVAENVSGGSSDSESSYVLYISLTSSGGGDMGPGGQGNIVWKNPVLYNSSGTMITSLTSTVTKSSGYTSLTFYYYDFKNLDLSDTYYIKGDNYTSRGSTYVIRTAAFSAPNGTDIYYSVTNSYTTSGTTRTYSLSNVTNQYGGTSDTSEENGTGYNAIGLKSDGDMVINGGTIEVSNSGAMSKSIKSKDNITINGGTITLNPSGAMQVINSDASYSSGIKCDDLTLNGGTVTMTVKGSAGRGISAKNVVTNGGTLTITNSGAGVSGTSDTYTAKCIKADTSVKLNAGIITLTASGTGGKGIKSAGTYTQGTSGGNGPTLKVTTSGSSLGGSSGGGGGWGPGGGQQSSGSSAKGIKVMGTAVIYGGTTEIYTSTDGAEGLESKTIVDIQGGQHYFKCYDDCINSSGCIYFNGGVSVCWSNGNDAVDSNYGKTGAITIGNGVAFAYTTRGAPEEGFDCDNNSYIQITGTGIGLSAGGAQGGGGSSSSISNAKQGYYFCTSTISYTSGRYYTLSNESGKNLVTYSFESSVSSSLALFTATGMVKGSKYYLKYSTTKPTDATTEWHGLYLGSSATGTTTVSFGTNSYFTAQ